MKDGIIVEGQRWTLDFVVVTFVVGDDGGVSSSGFVLSHYTDSPSRDNHSGESPGQENKVEKYRCFRSFLKI